MPSESFPEHDRSEKPDDTPAERAADSQPSLQDYSDDDLWSLNRKLMFATEHFDHRVGNLNQKIVGDAQVQAVFWQNIQERQLALKLASQELLERSTNFWTTVRERQDQHAAQMEYTAGLKNIDLNKARAIVPIELRTIEPTREENLADATAGAVVQGVEAVARAQTDRTQTSAANVAELTAARQVADTNIINTLAEIAGVVQTMQTQSATSQAAFQSLAAQVGELVGVVQALQENKKA